MFIIVVGCNITGVVKPVGIFVAWSKHRTYGNDLLEDRLIVQSGPVGNIHGGKVKGKM